MQDTSWEKVAGWYEGSLEKEGTYQKDLILPNLLRMMDIRKGDVIFDVACGQGFFSRAFAAAGAVVTGIDASRTLIDFAKKNSAHDQITYRVGNAEDLSFVKDGTADKVTIVLALQNIERAGEVLQEVGRGLKKGGRLFMVLNHPTFRIPHESEWGWDEARKIQYRRVDRYLSELKTEIVMHPGKNRSPSTLSFHRPLQFYAKALKKAGLLIESLEEWNSHKKSQTGPRAIAEDKARKEIPLFLCVVAIKQ